MRINCLNGYFFGTVKRAKRNKETIITSSLIIYVFFYIALGIGGFSFQSQPATGYLADPDPPTDPDPANNSFIDSAAPKTVSISANYTDSDGHSGTLTYFEQDTGNEIGSCSVNDGERCSVDWSASHGADWWYAVADDDGDSATTRSSNWMFVINQPPDKTTSPDSPNSGSTIYSDSTDLSAQVSDPDGDDLDATFYHNHSFSKTTGLYSSGSTASVSSVSLNRGENYKWWIDVSDGWNTTKSNDWKFYVNDLPNVYDADPDGLVAENNPELSVRSNDDNSNTLKAYFYNNNGNFLGKETFSSGGKANTTYSPDTDIGESYNWKVNVSDGFENATRTYTFGRTTSKNTRILQRIDYRYSRVIMSESDTRDIFFEVENRIDETKFLTTYVSGANAVFAENNQNSIDYDLEPESSRRFLVQIRPDSFGETYVNVTTENRKYGVNTTTRIPVTVKDYTEVSESSEVPGIGTIQLIMLLLVSAYLYSARL